MSSNSIESGSDPSTLVGECRVRKVFRGVTPVKPAIASGECVPQAFAPALKPAHGPDPGTLPANRLISPARILGLRAGSLVYRISDNS
jgi:hypothetical protein